MIRQWNIHRTINRTAVATTRIAKCGIMNTASLTTSECVFLDAATTSTNESRAQSEKLHSSLLKDDCGEKAAHNANGIG